MRRSCVSIHSIMKRLLIFVSLTFPLALVAKSPNVVFFLVDDLGWSDVACFGSSFYETPHIDRLAKEGVKFTSGYAACHVCSPTRASILPENIPPP
jgi:arylsulfatase A